MTINDRPDFKTASKDICEVGNWRIVAQQSVGPIKFGMTRSELREILAQPYNAFRKGIDAAELTDAFDTLDLHVFYNDGKVEAVELWNTENVILCGHRLKHITFADMEKILHDPFQPMVVTDTSLQSFSFGVELTIELANQRDDIGAIDHIIVVGPGYFRSAGNDIS
jgi:hypothetical protein